MSACPRFRFATEMKFLLPAAREHELLSWASHYLRRDSHADASGFYRVTSIYFDTEDFAVIHRRGSSGRCKFRIRRYGDENIAFLERKLRRSKLLAKRRTCVPLGVIACLKGGGFLSSNWEGNWFLRRLALRQLHPVCQISYLRSAFLGNEPNMRMTLDCDLRASLTNEFSFGALPTHPVISGEQRILELKYAVTLPLLYKILIETFQLEPVRISKYRLAASSLHLTDAGLLV